MRESAKIFKSCFEEYSRIYTVRKGMPKSDS